MLKSIPLSLFLAACLAASACGYGMQAVRSETTYEEVDEDGNVTSRTMRHSASGQAVSGSLPVVIDLRNGGGQPYGTPYGASNGTYGQRTYGVDPCTAGNRSYCTHVVVVPNAPYGYGRAYGGGMAAGGNVSVGPSSTRSEVTYQDNPDLEAEIDSALAKAKFAKNSSLTQLRDACQLIVDNPNLVVPAKRRADCTKYLAKLKAELAKGEEN